MNEHENQTQNHELPPNCKDILAQIGPIDTLLGSVSYNEIDNTADGKTQQLRTSARVFKKMKFDLSNSAALEKKAIEEKKEVKAEEVKPEVKKPPVNPFWTTEEKIMFFEAINEFGKDFETIHTYICTRLKKRGVPDEYHKNKHQIRHFYYKIFHMVCGQLKFNEKVPKNVQELYAVINYGEMWKKMGSISKKGFSKLGELVVNGCLAVRCKGKTLKIKTPMCRALRRLNQLDEKYDDLKLPTRVLVELRPKDMVSFLKVQSIAQNPRLKVAVSLQKRLSSLITCINTRWKNSEAVVYDKAIISTNVLTKDCVPDKKVIEESSSLLTPLTLLRLAPPPEVHVELPSIDITEYFTGQSISLNAYEMRKGISIKEEIKKEEPEVTNVKNEKSPTKQNNDENFSDNKKTPVNKVVTEAVNTILSLKTQEVQSKCDNKNELKTNLKELPLEEKQSRIALIRQGWTVENCACLTVGELYLMFGADSKLVLEYSWDALKIKPQPDEAEEVNITEEVKTKDENDLTNSLKKLLSLAKLHCNKTVIKCTCGHVCGAKTNTSTTQFKKPLTSRVVRKSQTNHEPVNVTPEEKVEDTNANPPIVQDKYDESFFRDQQFLKTTSTVAQLYNQRDNKIRNRGRVRYKQLVVERKLVPNKSESKHQIVSMNIVPQENSPSEEVTKKEDSPSLLNSGLPSLLLSDTSTSKIAEDTCLSNKSFSGLLDDSPSSNMSTGISKILNENDNQWIDPDVADFSLSSLLGHLDCPTKSNDGTQISNMSQDVDAQLRTLLIETSVDYTAKFADLAAQVVDNKK